MRPPQLLTMVAFAGAPVLAAGGQRRAGDDDNKLATWVAANDARIDSNRPTTYTKVGHIAQRSIAPDVCAGQNCRYQCWQEFDVIIVNSTIQGTSDYYLRLELVPNMSHRFHFRAATCDCDPNASSIGVARFVGDSVARGRFPSFAGFDETSFTLAARTVSTGNEPPPCKGNCAGSYIVMSTIGVPLDCERDYMVTSGTVLGISAPKHNSSAHNNTQPINPLPTLALPVGGGVVGGVTVLLFIAVLLHWKSTETLQVGSAGAVQWKGGDGGYQRGGGRSGDDDSLSSGLLSSPQMSGSDGDGAGRDSLRLNSPSWREHEEQCRQVTFLVLLVVASVVGTWSVVLVGAHGFASDEAKPLLGHASLDGTAQDGSWDLITDEQARQCSVAAAPRDTVEVRAVTMSCVAHQFFEKHMSSLAVAVRAAVASFMDLFFGFDLLWWVVVAKVGRAVGSRDYAFVAKYFKMGLCLSLVAAIFTAVLVFPFGPWLLDELFSLTPQVHSAAWPQLYLATVAKLLDYFKAVGLATVQGLQHLHVFVLLSCLDGLTAWGMPYLVEVAAHASQLWVAAAQVGRQLLWILVIFGYLGRFFQRQSSSGLIDLWGTKIEWLDWKIFLTHAASLLVAGYCAVVDAWLGVVVVNTIGVGTESVAAAEQDELLWTVLSYTFVLSGAFCVVTGTLGSKYIGQRDDAMFLRFALTMTISSLACGALLGLGLSHWAEAVLQHFTDNAENILAIQQQAGLGHHPLTMGFVATATLRGCLFGVAMALQQFSCLAIASLAGTLAYAAMVMYVQTLNAISLETVYQVSFAAMLVRTALLCWILMWVVPRKLRQMRSAESLLPPAYQAGGISRASTSYALMLS